jgi:two-component system, LytTR family, response regulator LytT
MSMTCVIVDDEYLAIKLLEQYAGRIPGLAVTKTFKSPTEALAFLQHHEVDLLLLDIQMPYLTGFELLHKLEHPPMVIFTTARHDHAVRAFELDVIDYLVKPIAFPRFEKAIARADEYREYLRFKDPSTAACIMIRADHRVHKIMLQDIAYLEGLSEYVKIHTLGKLYITHGTLKDLLEKLPASEFVRVHKSYIVAKAHIASYNKQAVQVRNGKELPVGRSFKDDFVKAMDN